jgi:photosystem II Psb27 protein
MMKSYLSRLFALVLVVVIGLMGCSNTPATLTGDYNQDTLTLISSLEQVIDTPDDTPEKAALKDQARQQMNDYTARYRRDSKHAGSRSFTTMQTAINALAGFYSSYGNRPIPEKLQNRLKQELQRVEIAVKRGR